LAVVTKVIVRLAPPPNSREILFVPFTSLHDAITTVPEIVKHGITPAGIEFIERDVITMVEGYTGREFPYHDHEAFLMIILEGEKQEETFEAARAIEEICLRHGAVGAFVPASEAAKRKLLDAREKFYPTLKSLGPLELADVVVPRSKIPEFIERVKEISLTHSIPILAYGHAGDGNVHLHLLGKDMDSTEWYRKVSNAFEDIYRLGRALGGVISGEHGLGFEKTGYLRISTDNEVLGLMKQIKRAFDPNNILNPGKILDLE